MHRQAHPQQPQPQQQQQHYSTTVGTGQGAKKKRPNEKTLPMVLLQKDLPESQLYMKLINQEKLLDALFVRKRLDIQEALTRVQKIKRKLRIFVSNTADNQPHFAQDDLNAALDFNATPPNWTLRITGKLLNGDGQTVPNGPTASSVPGPLQSLKDRKFTSFFKKIVIELDRSNELFSGNLVEWNKSQAVSDTDGFELKRRGDQDVNARIMFYLDQVPEKFKLSPQLSSLLSLRAETKPQIVLALWNYIKVNKLQDPNDHKVIKCDDALKSVFSLPQFQFTQIADLIQYHLAPADPIVFEYTISVKEAESFAPYYLDVEVEAFEDPVRLQMLRFVTSQNLSKDYAMLDQQISRLMRQINIHRLRRDFFVAFSKDPVSFIERWIASQARDMEVTIGDNEVNLEWQRRAEFYKEPFMAEAVFGYLSSKFE
ncbi:hypothetical protein MP638_002026 [Amoeboaphelidium occidentale]|nr:hypothetical protein MP638_002026 [Amoeboaphelidium occidentale]